MSVQINWLPSTDPFIASYDVERSITVSGPWDLLANIPHSVLDPTVFDPGLGQFFYIDLAGTPGYFYRLTSIDNIGDKSEPCTPFRAASGSLAPFSAVLVSEVLITAGNTDSLMALGYSAIQIWKSSDFGNSFQEITSETYASAKLHAVPPSSKYYLKDAVISFEVDGALTPDISFGSVIEYYTAQMAVDVINAVVPDLASVGSLGEVVITSPKVGRFSSVMAYKRTLASSFGFPSDRIIGTDQRIPLVSGQPIYFFYDPAPVITHPHSTLDGLTAPRASVRYKWRYTGSAGYPLSNFSEPVLDTALRMGVDPSLLSIGTAIFVTPDGRAQRKSVLISASSIQKVGNVTLSPDATMTVTADDTGFCQIPLVRGMKVTIAIEGTSVVREIIVPDSQLFDLMEALSEAPDQFTVQAPVPLLTRRSL